MIIVGDTQVHASKKRYGAFGDMQGSSNMQASNTQAAQAMQHVHNEKQRMKDEYQSIRR